jgi:hypothetical protein
MLNIAHRRKIGFGACYAPIQVNDGYRGSGTESA